MMRLLLAAFGSGAIVVALVLRTGATAAAPDANAGAKLVANSSCVACHGANLKGGDGPALYGIEHRRSAAQIAAAIENPKPPMPRQNFTTAQVQDIVAYLSSLDGGLDRSAPTVRLDPASPSDHARVIVTFPGGLPRAATVQAIMHMGSMTHGTSEIPLAKTSDPKALYGDVAFSMGGPWVIVVRYDGEELDVPVNVAESH